MQGPSFDLVWDRIFLPLTVVNAKLGDVGVSRDPPVSLFHCALGLHGYCVPPLHVFGLSEPGSSGLHSQCFSYWAISVHTTNFLLLHSISKTGKEHVRNINHHAASCLSSPTIIFFTKMLIYILLDWLVLSNRNRWVRGNVIMSENQSNIPANATAATPSPTAISLLPCGQNTHI